MSDDVAWDQRRECVKHAHENCLTAIANHYGHPAKATSVEVRAAISAALLAAFDLGVEFTHRKSTIPPPPPSDPDVASEALLAGLRRR